MVQLNRSMMERYEIADHRPHTLRAAIFGADRTMLGTVARLLDEINRQGGDAGAVCVTRAAETLQAQDGMFTLLVREDKENGDHTSEERVVQSILRALDPETEFEEMLKCAAEETIELVFISAGCADVELALAARFLYACWEAGKEMPTVVSTGEYVRSGDVETLRRAMKSMASKWNRGEEFVRRLEQMNFQSMLSEGLSGRLSAEEQAKARHDMNYRDELIAWAEPFLKCTPEGKMPEWMKCACADGDFVAACEKKARVFDALVFLCVSVGYLSGKDNFAQTLGDEKLREWIGRAFFDEIMPALPYARDEIAPEVISAFGRLGNSMNDVPLLEVGRGLLKNFPYTVLPAIRFWAEREFEAPRRLSLALAASIMLFAGARRNDQGVYEVAHGDKNTVIYDDPEILETFSRFSHDLPAETLAYAVLADRAVWGADLREIDGLEMRVAFDLSSIQRIGLRETMRLQETD